jgi:exopolysaccharide biosynthesis polyprenyl glycosylphosphotransferase
MSIRYSKYLPGFVFTCDLILVNLAFYFAKWLIYHSLTLAKSELIFITIANLIWVASSSLSKSYSIRRPLILRENLNRFFLALIYYLFAGLGIIYVLKLTDLNPMLLYISCSLFITLIVIFRSLVFFALDYIRKHGYNNRKVLILGDKNIADRLLTSFSKHPEYGYNLMDFISDNEILAIPEDEVFNRISSIAPDEIFICYKKVNEELLYKLINFGDTNFIKIKVVSDLVLHNNYAQLVNYHDVPVLQLTSKSEVGLKIRLLKRSFDVGFSLLVMISGIPVFIILYIVTKLSSDGPAFYKQERIGRNGKPFYIYKFRSMYTNSEVAGPQLSKDDDPRITKWGKIIRKTRLDELPQFWNVLIGDMSIVGPRPERQHFIEKIVERMPEYKKLLYLKPGLTSFGQVDYGYAENIDEMCDRLHHDMKYLNNLNLNSDLNIIMKTIKVMIQCKGK